VPAPIPREDRAAREPMGAAPLEIREPTTAPRMHRSSRRPGWLVPAAFVALLALAAVAVVLATSGGSDEPSTAADSGSTASEEPARERDTESGSGGAAAEEEPAPEAESGATEEPAPAPESESGTPTTPDGAVSAFYTAAANDDIDTAWSLSTERLHQQVQGYDSFAASQSTLESIEFPSLEVTEESGKSASVSFRSIARHESFTDRCQGSIAVVQQGGTWMVDHIDSASCDRS
jgi:hypothetical protein